MRTILSDPRYQAFVERYCADPLRFAVEVCGFQPSADQADLFDAISPLNSKVSVVSGTACFAPGTMMMRADGSAVAVEAIRVGDRLMGCDGDSVRNVLELKSGRDAMYRFTYTDGTSHVFNASHKLCLVATKSVRQAGHKCGDKIEVEVRDWLKWSPKRKKRGWAVYRSDVKAFERPAKPLPVPPYILGVWLGDGCTSKPSIHNPDPEVLAEWIKWGESLGCEVRLTDQPGCTHAFIKRTVGTAQANPAADALRAAGVFDQKRIPDAYLYASLEDRRELLAGLIDTDGHFDKNAGGYDWIQKDEALARAFAWLARSVGCWATVKECRKGCQTGAVGTYWRVNVGRNAWVIPARVARKRVPQDDAQQQPIQLGILSCEPLGEGDYFGFVLDGDHKFLGHDFTVLRNTGKTAAFGRIVLWHLLCFPCAIYEGKVEIGSNTYIGAPVLQQVADGVWKEIQDAVISLRGGPHAWVANYFEVTKTRVYIKGYAEQWFVGQVAFRRGEAVSIAGKHRFYQLIIIDEAAGVSDEHFNVVQGTQTQPGNRTLLASQGARNAGRFYDTHHRLSLAKGGSWDALCFSSLDSPFVTNRWIIERLIESGGVNSVEFRIRVLGLFADDSSNVLLTRAEVEAALSPVDSRGRPRPPIISEDEPYGWMILSDVGQGEYRDDSVAMLAKVIGYGDFGAEARRVQIHSIPIASNAKNEIDLAGDLRNMWATGDNATLMVDAGGVGGTVCKLIERDGGIVTKINWGLPCFSREFQQRYFNLRACAMVRMRDALKQGRLQFPHDMGRQLREKLIDQLSRLPYHFSEAGGLRYVMMAKEKMREEGIKSPDLADTASFAFLENAPYVVRSGASSAGGAEGAVESEVERMRARRAARANAQAAQADQTAP